MLSSIIALDGSVLNIARSPDGSAQINKNGVIILSATASKETKRLESVEVNDRAYQFEYEKRPNLGEVKGQRVVLSMDDSLSGISGKRGKLRTFSYSTGSDPALLRPELVIDGRVIEWDPISKRLVRDGDCKVDVKTGDWGVIEVARTRGDGSVAWIKRDTVRGIYETRDLSGGSVSWRIHSSGLLAGALRDLKITTPGGESRIERYIYDENAVLTAIRKQTEK